MGLLRFAVTATETITVQDILTLQNSIMRLSNTPSANLSLINKVTKEDYGPFSSKMFVHDLLNRYLSRRATDVTSASAHGIQDSMGTVWLPDPHTDRLFVFTMAAISGLSGTAVKHAIYKIGQMDKSTEGGVSGTVLDDYCNTNVYSRFAVDNTGLYSTFHRDSGSALYFGDEQSCADIPFVASVRRRVTPSAAKIEINGTTRLLANFSLAECVLFKRTFLRGLEHSLKKLTLSTTDTRDRKSLRLLQENYARILWYRAQSGDASVSTSSSTQEQYDNWARIVCVLVCLPESHLVLLCFSKDTREMTYFRFIGCHSAYPSLI
eukprot:m.606782 g.606782  ORF g.606782 m.606782 type:complete len:322 (-) comp22474_c0_seq5:284-1249(-)